MHVKTKPYRTIEETIDVERSELGEVVATLSKGGYQDLEITDRGGGCYFTIYFRRAWGVNGVGAKELLVEAGLMKKPKKKTKKMS